MDIQKAKQAIDACDIISFDIFDTLIVRLCARAEDIFRLVELKTQIRGFAKAREEMQRKCSLMVEKTRKEPHCTFSDIYEYMEKHFKTDMKGYTFDRLKQTELDTEKIMLVKNAPVYELFSYAKKAGKRVIAVSDMYLGKKELLPLLENCGYTDFDEVYISADVKKTKYRFDMFDFVAKSEGVTGEKILHIGDNKKDDFDNAKECGFNAFLYDGVRDKREMPLFNSVCAGVSCMLKNRDGGFWYGLGASVGGALYCGLIPLLLDEINKIKPEKLFFLSRDGYNMYEIFKRLKLTDIPMGYFYASRRALLLCGTDSLDGESKALLPPFTLGQSVMDILSYLDMADMDESYVKAAGFSGFNDVIASIPDQNKFRAIFEKCVEYFLQKAAKEREGLKKYLENSGYSENSLIFDAGWNGSSQFLLDRALGLLGFGESRFIYAGLMDTKKCKTQLSGKKYSSMLFDIDKNKELCERLGRSIVLLELFFGAPHAAVWKYSANEVLYEDIETEFSYKAEILRGIADCVETALPLLKMFDIKGGAAECLDGVYRLIEKPAEEEAVRIGDLENADGFAAKRGEKKYIARLAPSDIGPGLNEIYWPQGIYARPDMGENIKKFVKAKTGVGMKNKKSANAELVKPPNVFKRVWGYIDSYGLITTLFLIKSRHRQGTLPVRGGILGLADKMLSCGSNGKSLYETYIENTEKDSAYTEDLAYKPLFSFVIPVYNVEEKILRECIDSVLAQTMDNYELILADDRSTLEDVPRVLESYKDNEKITVIYRSENGHISRCTNTAIEAAKGEYIVFMDCDDTISQNALYELTRAVNKDRTIDFIYTDEDKLDESGRRHYPHFKPDWSPDTFMSHMYTSHLSAYRRSIINEIGGLRAGFEGAQDYDLTLRFTEKTNRVCHIPKILYHWRQRAGSTAGDLGEKPYVMQAMLKLKQEALQRRGLKGKVVYEPQVRQYRVVYDAPKDPLVSVIIPSKDNFDVLERCIESIAEKTGYKNYEIVVVDNGSCDEQRKMYADLCEKHNAVYKYEKADFNFSKMCNDGAKAAKGEYLLFLNDDTEVMSGGWLRAMLGQAALEYAGAVGAKLLYPNSSEIQHCGIINIGAGPCHAFIRSDDRVPQYFCRNKLDYNWIAVTAACLCINRKKFESVGGFDESFPIAYNDVELCFKLYEAGFYNVVRTDAVLYHYESVSRGADAKDKEKLKRLDAELERLYKKHPSLNRRDPFYNPAFSKTRVDFTLDPGLYALSNEIVGADMDISRYLSDRVRAELDTADAEDMLEIRGWAYIEGAALNNLNTCRLLLVNEENRALAIKTEKVLRFDISAMYGKKGSLNLAGFECAAKTSDIAGGTYKLGVMLINMGKKYVRLFDKTIEIK